MFDPYVNETWQKREGVLGEFQQGVRIATIRARVDKRVKALQASLKRQGISLSDKARVHALVVSRTKGGSAGAPPPTADPGSKAAASSADDPGAAVGLSYMGIAHFAFPEQPEKGAQPRGEPITVAPIEAFDETRLFALRVPRRYVQMEYQQIPLTPPGGFPPLKPRGSCDWVPSSRRVGPCLLVCPTRYRRHGACRHCWCSRTHSR